MIYANITGFFYTVWTVIRGEELEDEVEKPGFFENLGLSFEEKAYKFKSRIK